MNKTTCPDCGVSMLEQRRYPLEPLAAFMRSSVHAAAVWAGLSGDTQQRAKCHGITRRVADRISAQLKAHPAEIWPEVIDHDIDDTLAVCAADGCDERFMPRNRVNVYCSPRCKARMKMRRYRSTPAGKAANNRARKAYTATSGRYLTAYNRAYYRANRTERLAYQKAWRERNRDRVSGYAREYRLRKRNEAA